MKDPPYVDRFISYHVSIFCNLLHVKPAFTVKKIIHRKMKFLWSDLATSALCIDPCSNQVAGLDELVRNYNNTLFMVTDCRALLKTKCMITRPAVPWYNDDIRHCQTLKDGAYFCYCAYILRVLGYSGFLRNLPTDTKIFLWGLWLCGKSRS